MPTEMGQLDRKQQITLMKIIRGDPEDALFLEENPGFRDIKPQRKG